MLCYVMLRLNASKSFLYFPQIKTKVSNLNRDDSSLKINKSHENYNIFDRKFKRIQKAVKACKSLNSIEKRILREKLLYGVLLVAKGISKEKFLEDNSSHISQIDAIALDDILSNKVGLVSSKTRILGQSWSSTNFKLSHSMNQILKHQHSTSKLKRSITTSSLLDQQTRVQNKLRPYLLPPLSKPSTSKTDSHQMSRDTKQSNQDERKQSCPESDDSPSSGQDNILLLQSELAASRAEERRLNSIVNEHLIQIWSAFDLKEASRTASGHTRLPQQLSLHLKSLALEKLSKSISTVISIQQRSALVQWRQLSVEHKAMGTVKMYCKHKGTTLLLGMIRSIIHTQMRSAFAAWQSDAVERKRSAANKIVQIARSWIQNRSAHAKVLQSYARRVLAQRRKKRLVEERCLTEAAVILQHKFRAILAERRSQWLIRHQLEVKSAILLQKHFRRLTAQKYVQVVRESRKVKAAMEYRCHEEKRLRQQAIDKQRRAEVELIVAKREATRQAEEKLAEKVAKQHEKTRARLNEMANRARQKQLLAASEMLAGRGDLTFAPKQVTVKMKRYVLRKLRHESPHKTKYSKETIASYSDEALEETGPYYDEEEQQEAGASRSHNFLLNLSSVPLSDIPLMLSLESEQPLSAVSLDSCISRDIFEHSTLPAQASMNISAAAVDSIVISNNNAPPVSSLLNSTVFTKALQVNSDPSTHMRCDSIRLPSTDTESVQVRTMSPIVAETIRNISGHSVNRIDRDEEIELHDDDAQSQVSVEESGNQSTISPNRLTSSITDSTSTSTTTTTTTATGSGTGCVVRIVERRATVINRPEIDFVSRKVSTSITNDDILATAINSAESHVVSNIESEFTLVTESSITTEPTYAPQLQQKITSNTDTNDTLTSILGNNSDAAQFWNDRDQISYWIHPSSAAI